MTDAEVVVIKQFCSELIDKDLPALIAVEEARVPAPYGSIISIAMAGLMPQLSAFLDAKIAAL